MNSTIVFCEEWKTGTFKFLRCQMVIFRGVHIFSVRKEANSYQLNRLCKVIIPASSSVLKMRLGQLCKYLLNLKVSLRTSAVFVFGTFFLFLYIFIRGAFFFFSLDFHVGTVYVVATLRSSTKLTWLRHHTIRALRGLIFCHCCYD